MAAANDPDAVAWLESVAMRPMLESLLESICKDKPNILINYAMYWLRDAYPAESEKASCAAEETLAWQTRLDVQPTPDGLMAYLKEVSATVILEGIIERAIRNRPTNVPAYVLDEFAAMRAGTSLDTQGGGSKQSLPGGYVADAATDAIATAVGAMITAINDGDVERVEELLQQGVAGDVSDANGMIPLIAAVEGETECLAKLLEHRSDVNVKDKKGVTALMTAARYGDVDCVQMLLEYGADKEMRDVRGMSALEYAKEADAESIVELLDPLAAAAMREVAVPKKRAGQGRSNRRGSVSSESIDPTTKVRCALTPLRAPPCGRRRLSRRDGDALRHAQQRRQRCQLLPPSAATAAVAAAEVAATAAVAAAEVAATAAVAAAEVAATAAAAAAAAAPAERAAAATEAAARVARGCHPLLTPRRAPRPQVNLGEIKVNIKDAEVIQRVEVCIEGHLLFRALDTETRKALIQSVRPLQSVA